jgi:hypothetical protein
MSIETIKIDTEVDPQELVKGLKPPKYEKYVRFSIAALSSIPWVGGVIGASAALHAEAEQGRANDLICQWLENHHDKINDLKATLEEIVDKAEKFGQATEARLDNAQYLSLVAQGFKVWDSANTTSKRDYVRRTLTNAATTTICSDDLVRLFLEWIERYDETHFRVIRVLFQNRGATRGFIWDKIGGADVREDSADADLFKLLIADLSIGHVLRQIRQTNDKGQFLLKRRASRAGNKPTTLESAFEDTKAYELTAMGQQFATYVLSESVPQLS